jgi:hypothetical protein
MHLISVIWSLSLYISIYIYIYALQLTLWAFFKYMQIKDAIIWDVTLCLLVEFQRFEGTYCLNFQGQGVGMNEARCRQQAGFCLGYFQA